MTEYVRQMVRDGDPLKRVGTKKKYMHKRSKTTGKGKVNLWPQSSS